jgi:hypothetical protein
MWVHPSSVQHTGHITWPIFPHPFQPPDAHLLSSQVQTSMYFPLFLLFFLIHCIAPTLSSLLLAAVSVARCLRTVYSLLSSLLLAAVSVARCLRTVYSLLSSLLLVAVSVARCLRTVYSLLSSRLLAAVSVARCLRTVYSLLSSLLLAAVSVARIYAPFTHFCPHSYLLQCLSLESTHRLLTSVLTLTCCSVCR